MKVVIGSKNPVKVEVTEQAFEELFKISGLEVVACSADSNVSDQPVGTSETKTGAQNRAQDCKNKFPEADYWVGLEGGLLEEDGGYRTVAWACVLGGEGRTSFAPSAGFMLPPKVTELIKEGQELGVATDVFFGSVNSKHKGGTIGILTDNVVTRIDQYKMALIFALIPFAKPELYPSE